MKQVGRHPLSPHESRIADLITAGLSNRDIAAQLRITPGTVKAHISHIYAKLGVKSRVQLAILRWAQIQAPKQSVAEFLDRLEKRSE